MLEKLDNENYNGEKNNFEDDQVNIYDENKSLKIFEDQHKNHQSLINYFLLQKKK